MADKMQMIKVAHGVEAVAFGRGTGIDNTGCARVESVGRNVGVVRLSRYTGRVQGMPSRRLRSRF
jgi:hypothetical protein